MSRQTTHSAEEGFAALREGMRAILATELERALAPLGAEALAQYGPACEAGAAALEGAAYDAAARGARAPSRPDYADTLRRVKLYLPAQEGPYPDDVAALAFLSGRASAGATVQNSLAPPEPPTPREIIRRLFVRTLMAADARYGADRAKALEDASKIETSCYNAAVRLSKESEEPPRRQWDSPPFVDVYSSRCGAICRLLDPGSSACRAYGPGLALRLLGGELAPEALGDLSEKELCPQASAAERAEIAERSQQKVIEKESNLFKCPHCGERRSTYQEIQRKSLDEGSDYLCRCLNRKCRRRFTGRS